MICTEHAVHLHIKTPRSLSKAYTYVCVYYADMICIANVLKSYLYNIIISLYNQKLSNLKPFTGIIIKMSFQLSSDLGCPQMTVINQDILSSSKHPHIETGKLTKSKQAKKEQKNVLL